MTYEFLTLTHILGAAVIFGTGTGIAFFMWRGMLSEESSARRFAAQITVLADWLFTLPAVTLQPITGTLLIFNIGYDGTEPWLVASYGLYILAACCWIPVVRIQIRLRNLFWSSGQQEEIDRLFKLWFRLGWPAFGAVIGIYWLMIAKPELWNG